MKYACNKCHRVAEDFAVNNWLKITVHTKTGAGTNKEILLCPDCKRGFWKAVDHDITFDK